MVVKNLHPTLSTTALRDVIKFVKPNGVSNFIVHLQGTKKSYGGRAYPRNYTTEKILLKVGNNKYPLKMNGRNGYLSSRLFTEEELLVHLAAHELRHLWQRMHPRGYRVWGARGKYSERDADAYAIHMVREWRRKK